MLIDYLISYFYNIKSTFICSIIYWIESELFLVSFHLIWFICI